MASYINGKFESTEEEIKTRQFLANPHQNLTYHERLVLSKAIDLTDNYTIEDCGNGYSRIKPIDATKLVK